ncbi:PREDICTED: transcription factor bHLH130-like [Fragaria vesca subsp. vesca]|uniref:transcription factor bHLH130-like n=1 Tax=Fragaria vesca subsp. vesca TaxID=101020 RepID=UPI0002C300B3|nr:PREDICTED: transcription factor bHLH130-like [Fragaria vesca subsp. vesca]XP_011468810.1 PREDICTED: transcription factor bHLH130-like [Fragaria vesca subsp. vesca]XP_011468811.1 PREDICTED: transcription factor bHLH130-like [Fragaria vesca subsp. vesca]
MSSLLYSPQFKSSEAELRKSHTEFLDSSNGFQQQQSQQQQSSGLMRYRSAPSSVLLDLVDNNGGAGCEDFRDFRYPRPSSPEVETVLARFISSCNAPDGDNGSNHSAHNLFQERPVKQEAGDSVSKQNGYSNSPQMMYQTQQVHPLDNASSFGAFKSTGLENSMQSKMGAANRSNLVRQSSSPAGFFPNLNVDNGFNLMKDASSFGVSNGTNGEASPSTSRLSTQFSFSSASPPYSTESRRLPRIAEIGNGNIGEGSEPDQSLGNAANGGSSHYIPDYIDNTWDNVAFHDLKRGRDNDGNKFSTTAMDTQIVDFGHRSHGLTHHLSLPKHFEMPGMEKLLHFQDSVPCKIRAKRGFATHPRSIAERMRRTRISERMRKLQDLFPNMDKQTNTAEMLELAVEYIKDLQKEVKTLKDTKAKCSCSSKHKHN